VKFTLSWLRTHLDTDATLERLTDTLSSLGLEVEGVADPAAPLTPVNIRLRKTSWPEPFAGTTWSGFCGLSHRSFTVTAR